MSIKKKIAIFTFILLTIGCKMPYKHIANNQIKYQPTTWINVLTFDIAHYDSTLADWRESNSKYVIQFPDIKYLSKKRELYYSYYPKILQGGSGISLIIHYRSLRQAEKFFTKFDEYIDTEYIDKKSYEKSWHCFEEALNIKTYTYPEDIHIKLLHEAPYCDGKGDIKLGGLLTSIALDKKKKIIICSLWQI